MLDVQETNDRSSKDGGQQSGQHVTQEVQHRRNLLSGCARVPLSIANESSQERFGALFALQKILRVAGQDFCQLDQGGSSGMGQAVFPANNAVLAADNGLGQLGLRHSGSETGGGDGRGVSTVTGVSSWQCLCPLVLVGLG